MYSAVSFRDLQLLITFQINILIKIKAGQIVLLLFLRCNENLSSLVDLTFDRNI